MKRDRGGSIAIYYQIALVHVAIFLFIAFNSFVGGSAELAMPLRLLRSGAAGTLPIALFYGVAGAYGVMSKRHNPNPEDVRSLKFGGPIAVVTAVIWLGV